MASPIEKLQEWKKVQPEKKVYTFMDDSGNEVDSYTYEQLDKASQALASLLLSSDKTKSRSHKGLGLKSGKRVLLVYLPSLDFIVAFLACLKAGVVPVPVYPPDPRKLKKDVLTLLSVCENCQATVALTSSSYGHIKRVTEIKEMFSFRSTSWPELEWFETDKLLHQMKDDVVSFTVHQPLPNDLAFLQYTSGSTADPKGVMISHANLSHNLTVITSSLQASTDTIVVSWLPQYHDMGLIGAYLGVLYCGGSGYYMSPYSFIKNPSLWIESISKYRGTHVQAPNFAYALCARKANGLKSPETIDLSSLKHMINAAEPIDHLSMEAFYTTFRPFHLPENVIFPTYGLAEHTVYVCDGGKQRIFVDKIQLEKNGMVQLIDDPQQSTADSSKVVCLVGCGCPKKNPSITVKIVDMESLEELGENRVGEIWIHSPSKALGYFGGEQSTKEVFHAKLQNSSDQMDYLRTGDLGLLRNGELFVCGRSKDLIIIRGRNHFPQDIEKTAERSEEVRPGCVASFSLLSPETGEEVLALVAELRDPRIHQDTCQSLASTLKKEVALEHGVSLAVLVFLPPHTIPKTTSGKIARRRCKLAFESNSLEKIIFKSIEWESIEWEPQTLPNMEESKEMETCSHDGITAPNDGNAILQKLISEVVNLTDCRPSQVDSKVPLPHLGMDSMAITQLKGIISHAYQVDIKDEVLYDEHVSLEKIKDIILAQMLDTVKPNVSGDQATSFLNRDTTSGRKCCCCCCSHQ